MAGATRGRASGKKVPRQVAPVVRLVLLRHGPAGLRTAWEGDDADRPLTADGVKKVKRIARRLADQHLEPDLVVTSPYARSAKTARLVAKELGVRDLLVEEEKLAPGFGVADLLDLLGAHRDAATVLVVGHEPDLSEIVADLCGGRIKLQKGGVAELELEFDGDELRTAALIRLAQPSYLLS